MENGIILFLIFNFSWKKTVLYIIIWCHIILLYCYIVCPLEANNKQVLQEPAFEVAEPGTSVTLNCSVKPGTCTAEHSVYWVRHGSRQGILHIDGDQCKRSPTSGSQSCMYHLQRINVSSSDTGTYFCAVSVCGEILFGNGTVLQISSEKGDPEGQIRVLVWLSIIRMGALLVFVIVCLIKYLSKRR